MADGGQQRGKPHQSRGLIPLFSGIFLTCLTANSLWAWWAQAGASLVLKPEQWVELPGTVTASRREGKKYDITYEFAYDGRTNRSGHVRLSPKRGRSKSYAEEYVRKYPVGASVTVHYQKTSVGLALLEPWPDSTDIFGLVFGLGLIAGGTYFARRSAK